MPPLAWAAAAVAAGAGLATLLAWLDVRRNTQKPKLQYTATAFNQAVLERCPALYELYKPFLFFTNCHFETIVAARTRRSPGVDYRREFLMARDGGCVALDWVHAADASKELPEDAPVLILLPGLTGGSGDPYIQHAVIAAQQQGVRAVVFNSRGTAGTQLLTPQFYSASFTGDMRAVVAHVAQRYPRSTLLAAGWSLGANIMMRYLGEEGDATPLSAAVSMCNPFTLPVSNAGLQRGFNVIYDRNLAEALRGMLRKNWLVWAAMDGVGGFQPRAALESAKTIYEFDDYITIRSFGWASVEQYYQGSSSALSVPHITIPLLCLQALDDPIAPKEAIPYEALAANPNCVLATTPVGGHLGWVAGPTAPFGAPWSNRVMIEWLTSALQQPEVVQRRRCVADAAPAVVSGDVRQSGESDGELVEVTSGGSVSVKVSTV